LALAGPLVLSFWFRSLFQWVDTIYASTIEGLGDASIAAIGLTLPFEFMMIACWVGTSNSLTSRLAAAMGAEEGAKVTQLLSAARRLVVGLGVLFIGVAAAVFFFADSVGLEPDVAAQFRIYGTVLLAGSSVTVFWSILPDSIVKAHHDTKTTMWAGMTSTVLNLILNTLFLFVFHWGIFGIGLATVLGRLGGLSYGLVRAASLERERIATSGNAAPSLFERPVRALVILAVPAGLSFLFMALESFAFNGLLARSDQAADSLAAWSLLDRAGRFLIMPIIALGVATLPLVARLRGAGSFERMRRELRLGLEVGTLYAVFFVTPLAMLVGPVVARSLTDSPAAGELATLGMYCLPVGILFSIPLMLVRPAFEGLQRARPGLVLSGLRTFVLVIPLGALAYLQAPHLGLEPIEGLVLGAAAGSGLASLAAWSWIRRQLAELTS
jgi:Na+-driven multidrug efflux pump